MNIVSELKMAYKEKETVKLFYSITEVAETFKVNASLIRYWEKEFDILKPKLNKKGNRLFTEQDIEAIKIIFNLVKVQGLTIDGAKKYLKVNKSTVKHEIKTEVTKNTEIETSLLKIKKSLLELRDRLQG